MRDAVADLYIVLFDAILKNPEEVGHGREGFYFGENGEHTLLDISAEIGKALVALGKAKTDEVTPFSDAELDKYYGGVRLCPLPHPFGADGRGLGNSRSTWGQIRAAARSGRASSGGSRRRGRMSC